MEKLEPIAVDRLKTAGGASVSAYSFTVHGPGIFAVSLTVD